jgi:hypothetical protein
MSVFKNTFSRALRVIPSDNADIPSFQDVTSGTNTSAVTNQLVNTSGDFINANVAVGDVVYNITDGTAATVVSVSSATVVVLNANIFAASEKNYIIYQESPQTGLGNPGCYLYVGAAGNVAVTTLGGDEIIFNAVPVGTVLPVQVSKLKSTGTTATLVNALW